MLRAAPRNPTREAYMQNSPIDLARFELGLRSHTRTRIPINDQTTAARRDICEAATGMGKTLAAIEWFSRNRTFEKQSEASLRRDNQPAVWREGRRAAPPVNRSETSSRRKRK